MYVDEKRDKNTLVLSILSISLIGVGVKVKKITLIDLRNKVDKIVIFYKPNLRVWWCYWSCTYFNSKFADIRPIKLSSINESFSANLKLVVK